MNSALMADNGCKRVLVVGLGETGLSCVRHLAAQGHRVTVVDDREAPAHRLDLRREFPQVPLHAGRFDRRLLSGHDLVVISPGVPRDQALVREALEAGMEVIGDIELFARTAAAPVLAITGSNGKSTVTRLAGEMCAAAGLDTAVGGNIGVPALSLLRRPEPEAYVLELSSFQLESTFSLNARAATVLNVSADHMDRYAGLDAYTAAKARIFDGDGRMVLNADDPQVMRLARPGRETVRFGLGPPATPGDYGLDHKDGEPWLLRGGQALMPARELALPGRHNLANVLAAMALVESLGVEPGAMVAAARRFRGLPHRMQPVAEHGGVLWIDDSKATNVGATVAALEGMERPVILIAGGDGKAADFSPLREPVRRRVRRLILMGQDAPRLESLLAPVVDTERAADMVQAVQRAAAAARPGEAVLLSPACASFDMYTGFEHRGRVFAQAVRACLGLEEMQE